METVRTNEKVAVVHSERIRLRDALRRCEKEAVRGICETGRYRCSYYTWGQGPPLLLIPGMADDALSFVQVAALLSDQFRCTAYDLPAGGGDGARLTRYRHADLVADLFALLDHLQAPQSYLLASSFGSTIALVAMHEQPRRLPRAVLQGGFACRRLTGRELFLARVGRYLPGRQQSFPFRSRRLRRVHHRPFIGREPEIWHFMVTRWGLRSFKAMARQALMLHRLDLRRLLPGIRQPVLLVAGDCDPLVSKESEEELLRGLPNAGRVELSGCGHAPIFSHAEVLAEVVRCFLTPMTCAL